MRFLSLFLRFVVCSVCFGCTTTSLKQVLPPNSYPPPNPISAGSSDELILQLEKQLASSSEAGTRWWVRYNQARLAKENDPIRSCEYFVELSEEPAFPLREIALIRAYQTCSRDETELAPLDIDRLKKESWLKDTITDLSLEFAKAKNDIESEMEIYVQKSKVSVHRPEKIELMKTAIQLAKQLNRPDKVEEYTKRLYFLSPHLQPDQPRKDRLTIAYDLRRDRKFNEARKIYYQVIADPKSSEQEILKSLHGLRAAFKLERKTKEYIRATQNIAQYTYRLFQKNKTSRKTKGYYGRLYRDSVLLYVRTLWTDGQVSQSVKMLSSLGKEIHGFASREQVYWLLGRISEEGKQYNDALHWFSSALNECPKRCSLEKNLMWYKAWVLNKMSRHKEAAVILASLTAKADESEKPKYLFWWAKQLAATGEKLEARSKYSQLIQEDPLGYYGLLAHRELKIPFASTESRQPASEENRQSHSFNSFLLSKDGTFVSWLISVGENSLAEDFLNDHSDQFRKQRMSDLTYWREILSLYARAQSFTSLFATLQKLPADLRRELLSRQPQIIFPQPYNQEVTTAAKKFGVPSELIYSIMRQESAFNHQARSPADAFGLMQLIPSVARQTADKMNISLAHHEDLYHPETNIVLGSAFLKKLWDRYNGQFVILAASYNASEKAIKNWIKHRYEGDTLQFIEDIPYEETRNYIKLVLRNLIIYQRLNAEGQTVAFPEWCLENIQDVNI